MICGDVQGQRRLWTTQFSKSPLLEGHAFDDMSIEYGHTMGKEKYVQMVAFVDRPFPPLIAQFTSGR